MEKIRITPAFAKSGMDKDTHPSLLDEAKYTHAKNANIENETGGFMNLSTEHSNILASKFKSGFRVIHAQNDINSNNTYFFLLNPTTGTGEFGVIENTQNILNLEDLTVDCGDCNQINELSTPLEEITQIPLQTYTTLISDACKTDKTEGFNFNILNPIKTSVIKNEKLGTIIYFSHKGNPPRYINISRISDYFTQEVVCGDDITLTCPDFEKMLVFKPHSIPKIETTSIELGGNLKRGVYEFAVALCDSTGNIRSEYYSNTIPTAIFDQNDRILEQPQLADRTNFGIKLKVSNLDTRFTHYKIAVIQTADIEGASSYYEVGVFPISTDTVTYTTEQGKKSTSVDEIARPYLFIEEAENVATANNVLYQYGLKQKAFLNLQPVVNFMGEFFQWQTHIAPENIYENGVLASKFTGYQRDEVYPLGIRFLLDGGMVTPTYPLVGRQVRTGEEVVVDNTDSQSIADNKTACTSNSRDKRWQLYNTATVDDGFCSGEDIEFVEITEETIRFCEIDDVASIASGTFSIELDEPFTTFEEYINDQDNRDNCAETLPSEICDILDDDYSLDICAGLFDDLNCTESSLVEGSEQILATSVVNEVVTRIRKDFPSEYVKLLPPQSCGIYLRDDSNNKISDDTFETLNDYSSIWSRNSDIVNQDCDYAKEILQNTNVTSATYDSNYFDYDSSADINDLITAKNSYATATNFNTKIHEKSLWFSLPVTEEEFILDITKQKDDSSGSDDFDALAQDVRFNILKTCGAASAIFSTIVDMNSGAQILFKKSGADLIVTVNNTAPVTIIGGWSSSKFIIVAESKLLTKLVNTAPPLDPPILVTRYVIAPTKGCFSISKRPAEDKRVDITWDSISFKKVASYSASCTYEQPIVSACDATPYKKGDFAYWESEETYPDNQYLYDSSNLIIESSDFSTLQLREKFEDVFTEGSAEGVYLLGDSSDLRCKNIRHFKMPDNEKAPFIITNTLTPLADSLIFPLGITVNEEVIVDFLNVAEKNNLISKTDRQKIKSYEIVRGNMGENRSVIASGLLYDMRQYYDEDAKRTLHYSNYPYNSYRNDIFNLDSSGSPITHEGWGNSNTRYTFHSPETDYNRPTVPSELSVQGFLYGNAKINFDEVKGHSKWTMLSGKAKDLAGILAGLEVGAEIAIQALQATSNAQVWTIAYGGASNGFGLSTGAPAFTAGTSISIIGATTAALFKWAQYRYEWLTTFRNLGAPHNFAYYQFSEGKYSNIGFGQTEGQKLRGLNVGEYLMEGMYSNTNPTTGITTQINNLHRERSLYLDLGTHPITYPTTYKNYDKSTGNSSLTYLGENGLKQTGRSSDIIRNIASPYSYLKNYLASQHGSINSIIWLNTGYRGDLVNPSSDCLSIFGGDTYITRHTLKRKMPQFLLDAVDFADKTPFNYYQYNNIGKNPKFYVSYNLNKDVNRNGSLLPDIDDEYNMDNFETSGNYRTPPSKFYLYHYGVPSFLCESRINSALRYGKTQPDQNFFPNAGDIGDWTQEKQISIRRPNQFYYHSPYSKSVESFRGKITLSPDYNPTISAKRNNQPNGILASMPDNSENALIDPWLIYRPLDIFEFPTDFGKLKSISQLENEAILTRFENTNVIYNKVDYTNDDGQSPSTTFVGGVSTFQRRSSSFVNAEIGFGGTQNTTSVSCEAGHFHVDAKRGQVIQVMPGGQGSEEISSTIGGKPSGMRNWFKQHLPFKIQKYFKDIDIDNNFNGVGISMGWDSRFRRLFITKKDYIPLSDCVILENGKFYDNCGIPNCTNSNLVVNGSFDTDLSGWTGLFYPVSEQWSWSEGKAWFNESNDQTSSMYQDILEIGKSYRIRFDMFINPMCGGYVKVHAGGTESGFYTQEGQSSVDIVLTCTGNTKFIMEAAFFCGSLGEYFNNSISIDNVCVIEESPLKVPIDITDTNYFKEVSWSIAYSPILGSWMSFYDFKPNYYVNHQNYFQTGINSINTDFGLWSHLLTNKSYLVFYGKKYSFDVEYVTKSEQITKKFNNVELWTEAKRYHNAYDFAFSPDITFNKVMIHNNTTCSGDLNLIPQKNNLFRNRDYPKTNANNTQDILITNKDNFKWAFDYFFNRVKSNVTNQPFILNDENQIEKEVNPQAVSFKGKRLLDRLEGDWNLVRLKYDKDSRYHLNFKFTLNEQNI
jgi:hypothetical protein